jgi:hypothetical protein
LQNGRHKRCQWSAEIELICNNFMGAAAHETTGNFSESTLKYLNLFKKYFKQQQNMKCYFPGSRLVTFLYKPAIRSL